MIAVAIVFGIAVASTYFGLWLSARRWERQQLTQCDGCNEHHDRFRLNAASGDTMLCNRCIASVMKHGKYPHELSREDQCMLDVEMRAS